MLCLLSVSVGSLEKRIEYCGLFGGDNFLKRCGPYAVAKKRELRSQDWVSVAGVDVANSVAPVDLPTSTPYNGHVHEDEIDFKSLEVKISRSSAMTG